MHADPLSEAEAPYFRKLSQGQLSALHAASLEILERTGVCMRHDEALGLLRKAGAHLLDDGWVRIPARLVEWALQSAPKRIAWADRNGRRTVFLEGRNVFYGPGSDCPYVIDVRDGQRREGRLADIVESVRVMDALPNIGFLMSFCMAHDVPQPTMDRRQMKAMLENSTKPILFVTTDFPGCADAIEMAELVAGGADALRRNPLCACYINVTSPLVHNAESLDKLLFMADRQLPCTYNPVVLRGANGPVTPAGAVALANAGELAGLVVSQLRNEGAPVILSGGTQDMLDMRTTGDVYAAPENRVLCVELAHYYDMPVFGLGGCSDSQLPDEQAASEIALTLLTETLAGSHLIHDVGYLASGMTNSLESLVMADELINWVRRFTEGVTVDEETLALDLIHEAGPANAFMQSDHTRAHYREDWYPNVIERRHWDAWSAAGAQTFRERARKRALSLLESHVPEPLPEDLSQALDRVIERADARWL
jgi:trimethylamine--corrinoid protein Co-methyltransferase